MKALNSLWILLVFSLPVQAQELRAYIPLKIGTEQAGPYVRLMARIGELTGVTFKLEDALPPTRAKLELQAGLLDCSIGQGDLTMADIAADVTWAKEPLVVANQVVISLQPFTYTSQADFAGRRVMAVRESAPVGVLTADRRIQMVEAPDAVSALKMLLAKRADHLVMHEVQFANALAASPEIKKEQFFVAATPYLAVKNLIWFSKKYEALSVKVDAALKQLKSTGEYARIMAGRS